MAIEAGRRQSLPQLSGTGLFVTDGGLETELDEGDPVDLGTRHVALRDQLSSIRVLGGCCGTDARHVAAIVSAWRAYEAAARK